MIEETCLDLETALKKHNAKFFQELPQNFSSEKYKSAKEIAENFCFCKAKLIKKFKLVNVVFVKSQMRTDNQEKELCKKIIRNLESANNYVSYIHKLSEIFNV